MSGLYQVLISVFLCLTVWLKLEVIWPLNEVLHVRFDPVKMGIHLQWDFLSVLFVVPVLRDLRLTNSLGSSLNEMNENTEAIAYNRHTFFFI